jgi:hypothetical protein
MSMTLEQYAQIGEIIAAIAVIASLIYVAQQLHQNTDMMRVGNAQHFVDFNISLVGPIVANRELADLWIKGGSDFETLDPIDKQRVVMLEWQAIAGWYNFFNLRQKHLMSDEQWHEVIWVFENIGRRQAVREAWKTFKGGYDKSFQEFMAQYLESDPESKGD